MNKRTPEYHLYNCHLLFKNGKKFFDKNILMLSGSIRLRLGCLSVTRGGTNFLLIYEAMNWL